VMLQSSRTPNYDSSKVPMADIIYAADIQTSDEEADGKNKNGGIFCSSTARALLAISSVALLLLSLFGLGSTGAPNIKDLSDTVIHLTQQYQNIRGGDENNIRELEALKHQLVEKEIELAWEKQHVDSQTYSQELMFDSMLKQINKDHEVMEETENVVSEVSLKTWQTQAELEEEQNENANLKVALAFAIEELARARSLLPAVPPAGQKERKLRGGQYQPGDNIEIIEYQEGGMVALRPGIVSDVNSDGTYNLVKLEQGKLLKNFRREQFQTHHIYHEGMLALFEESQEVYAPITIVQLVPGSTRENFELHGSYQFTFDRDEKKEIHEGLATKMHRFAGVGDIIGE
jgi:hypothetical protein